MPEAVGTLVEVRHGEIRRDRVPVLRAAPPDRRVREEALVNPCVALLEFLCRHVPGAEDRVASVVERPVLMKNPALGLHLAKERRCRIRSEDMKCRTFQAIFFDPIGGAGKDIFAVVIETENKRSVYLNAT